MASPLLATLKHLQIPVPVNRAEETADNLRYRIAKHLHATRPSGFESAFSRVARAATEGGDGDGVGDAGVSFLSESHIRIDFPVTSMSQGGKTVVLPVVFRVVDRRSSSGGGDATGHESGRAAMSSASFESDKPDSDSSPLSSPPPKDQFGVVDRDGRVLLDRAECIHAFLPPAAPAAPAPLPTRKVSDTSTASSSSSSSGSGTSGPSHRTMKRALWDFARMRATLLIQFHIELHLRLTAAQFRLALKPIMVAATSQSSSSPPSTPSSPKSTVSEFAPLSPPSAAATYANDILEWDVQRSPYAGLAFRAMSTAAREDGAGPFFGVTGVFAPCLGGVHFGAETAIAAVCSIWLARSLHEDPGALFARHCPPQYTHGEAPAAAPLDGKAILPSAHMVDVLAFLVDFNGHTPIVSLDDLHSSRHTCLSYFGASEATKLGLPWVSLSPELARTAELAPLPSASTHSSGLASLVKRKVSAPSAMSAAPFVPSAARASGPPPAPAKKSSFSLSATLPQFFTSSCLARNKESGEYSRFTPESLSHDSLPHDHHFASDGTHPTHAQPRPLQLHSGNTSAFKRRATSPSVLLTPPSSVPRVLSNLPANSGDTTHLAPPLLLSLPAGVTPEPLASYQPDRDYPAKALFSLGFFSESAGKIPWFDYLEMTVFEDLASSVTITNVFDLPATHTWRTRMERMFGSPKYVQKNKQLTTRERKMVRLHLSHAFESAN